MAKVIRSLLFGTVFVLMFTSLHFLIVQLYFGEEQLKKNIAGDYFGIEGNFASFPLHCDTCALVGTSGHLLNSELGEEIDNEHLCIFRLGFSPTKGFENDVGSRTTVRIVDSFRFYPFLKKPWKSTTGSYRSDIWILFDKKAGDISNFHGPILKDLAPKLDSRFLWMTRDSEKKLLESLPNRNLNFGLQGVSALWFSTKVLEDAKCDKLDLYGISSPKICKENLNVSLPSLYWENASTPICVNGQDASYRTNKSETFISILPTVPERRAFPLWAKSQLSQFQFKAPSWTV